MIYMCLSGGLVNETLFHTDGHVPNPFATKNGTGPITIGPIVSATGSDGDVSATATSVGGSAATASSASLPAATTIMIDMTSAAAGLLSIGCFLGMSSLVMSLLLAQFI